MPDWEPLMKQIGGLLATVAALQGNDCLDDAIVFLEVWEHENVGPDGFRTAVRIAERRHGLVVIADEDDLKGWGRSP